MELDIDYLLSMSQRKIENVGCFLNPTTVYKEVLCCFNECNNLYI